MLSEPLTGRTMQVSSSAAGVQVYAGHGLKADPVRDRGRGAEQGAWLWQPGDGICLEPMGYPDAPNQPGFPVRWLAPATWCEGPSCTASRAKGCVNTVLAFVQCFWPNRLSSKR